MLSLEKTVEQLPLHVMEFILKNSYDEISVIDAKGYIIYENRIWEERYRDWGGQLVGMHISRIPLDICDCGVAEKVFEEKSTVHILQKIRNNPKNYFVVGIPLLDSQGEIEYVITISRDLSLLQNVRLTEGTSPVGGIATDSSHFVERVLEKHRCVARSTSMRSIFSNIERLAQVDATLLITGESGTGKSFLTRVLHDLGPRADKKLILINCAAIPAELLEMELFGYEPGAFTGASHKGKPGLFELANGGTLFLDEIGELSLPLQSKLLGVLQNKTMRRLGSTQEVALNVRLVCATNAHLESMVKNKLFREDLYYRINVLRVVMPSLRERRDDFLEILEGILLRFNTKYSKVCYFSKDALHALQEYAWPGNIRELENMVEGLIAMASKPLLSSYDLPTHISKEQVPQIFAEKSSYDEEMEKFSRSIIQNAVKSYKTSYKVANALSISQSKATRLMKKYGLTSPEK